MIGVGIGAPELLIILAVLLLMFGARRLPGLARSLGKSSREFRKGMAEGADEDDDDRAAASGSGS